MLKNVAASIFNWSYTGLFNLSNAYTVIETFSFMLGPKLRNFILYLAECFCRVWKQMTPVHVSS